jgi:hypothetical protein
MNRRAYRRHMCRDGVGGVGGKQSMAVMRHRKRVAAVQCADMDGVRTGASITAAAERDTLLCSLKKTCSSSMVISREWDPNSMSPPQRERRGGPSVDERKSCNNYVRSPPFHGKAAQCRHNARGGSLATPL